MKLRIVRIVDSFGIEHTWSWLFVELDGEVFELPPGVTFEFADSDAQQEQRPV